jgi:serine/threonine protein kinase
MAQLSNHANVVRLLEVLELTQSSQSTLFAVMELVPGGELFDHIIMGCGTPEETSARYFLQLLRGLSYCHDQG